jgi:vacuolar protein sorting-associated protein 54
MIENEQWAHVEVPVDFQEMLNEIIKSAPNDGEGEDDHRLEGLLKKQTSEQSLVPGSTSTLTANKKGNLDLKMSSFLKVGSQNYFVVGFMLLFIKAMHDYIQVAKNVPSLTTDVLHRLFDLLKVLSKLLMTQMVNSKTCQMVLGAGALKSAGLKNITAKHIGNLI